jgi:hypothetical protein
MTITLDKTFMPPWDVLLATGALPDIAEYCYPGAVKGGFVDGVYIEVCPTHGDHWMASFSAGSLSPNAASAVIALPDLENILVISLGEAYVVSADCPSKWQHVKLHPVMGWVAIHAQGMLLLWDFNRVIGYDRTGEVWRTPSISWDGIEYISTDGNTACLNAWDAVTQTHKLATVDLKTGAIKSDWHHIP